MEEVIVTTQAEMDALPKTFSEFTIIKIQNTNGYLISVVARGNSSVVAWGNSRVEAWGNSRVEAGENSRVVARGNSRVEAWGQVSVHLYSDISLITLFMSAVCFVHKLKKYNIKKKSKTALIQKVVSGDWFSENAVEEKKTVILYKKVSKDFKTMEDTEQETLWKIGATLEHDNWDPEKEECGGGKYHACARPYFCDEFRNKTGDRYIAIEIARKDTFAWKNPDYPHKIAFRKGKVLYECDRFGEKKTKG